MMVFVFSYVAKTCQTYKLGHYTGRRRVRVKAKRPKQMIRTRFSFSQKKTNTKSKTFLSCRIFHIASQSLENGKAYKRIDSMLFCA